MSAASKFNSLTTWAKGDKATYEIALKKKIHRKIGEQLGWTMRPLGVSKEQSDPDFEIAKFLIRNNASRELVSFAMDRLK